MLLLSATPSSAAIERVFLNVGAIHTKLDTKNRWKYKGIETMFCYKMLQGQIVPDY